MEIFLHEPHVYRAQHHHRSCQVEVSLFPAVQISDCDDCLYCHIDAGYHYMRYLQFVGHQLVQMFPVRKPDVFVQHQSVNNGQHTVHSIDGQQDNPTEIFRLHHQFSYQEQQNKGNAYRTYISGKTLGPFPEVEQAEHQHGCEGHPDKLRFHKCHHFAVHIRQYSQYHQRITARNAVDAIHKVVGIDDTRADYQSYHHPPPGQCIQPPLSEHQSHGRKMEGQSRQLSHRFHVVPETDESHQRQCQHKPGIFSTADDEISQCSEVEDDSPTPQRDACMAAPFVRFVYDIQFVRYAKVQQFHRQQHYKSQNIFHRLN